jgi:hypothetical protein
MNPSYINIAAFLHYLYTFTAIHVTHDVIGHMWQLHWQSDIDVYLQDQLSHKVRQVGNSKISNRYNPRIVWFTNVKHISRTSIEV